VLEIFKINNFVILTMNDHIAIGFANLHDIDIRYLYTNFQQKWNFCTNISKISDRFARICVVVITYTRFSPSLNVEWTFLADFLTQVVNTQLRNGIFVPGTNLKKIMLASLAFVLFGYHYMSVRRLWLIS